jgi:hypothetical protein
VIAATGADLQDAIALLGVEELGHDRHHVGGADRLVVADR